MTVAAASQNPDTEAERDAWSWAFFAPAAVGLLPAILLACSPVEKNEVYEWTQHRLAGGAFASAFVLAFLFGPWRRSRTTTWCGAVSLLALGLVVWRDRPVGFQPEFIAAGGLVAVGYWFCGRRDAPSLPGALALALGSTLCIWSVSALWWWSSFWRALHPWPNSAIFLGTTAVLVGLLTELSRGPRPAGAAWSNRAIDVIVLVALGAALLRTNNFDPRLLDHWSVYTGPADMVREGGSLLGDVPSQYGFLNILLLAAWPADDRFTALFWLHNTLVWISGAIVYCSLKAWLARWWWQLFAGLIVVCSVAFLSGDASMLSGPQRFPSGAAMRFIWVYVLVGFLMWQCAGSSDWSRGRVLWTGSVLWLLGVLWSLESALYVTAAWFPAASLLALPGGVVPRRPFARLLALGQGILHTLALAGGLLACALLVVTGYYRLILERWPDFPAFWEYATTFSGGFFSLPMDPQGGVWALLMLHCALIGAVVSFEPDRDRRSLALVWAAWGALWSVSTYYVARSHSNVIPSLGPVLLLVTSALVHAWLRSERRSLVTPWIWLVVPTVVGGMVWLVLPNREAWQRQIRDYAVEPHVGRLLAPTTPELGELIGQCRQRQPGPYSVIGRIVVEVVAAESLDGHPDWLPLRSVSLWMPLSPERRSHYLDGYLRRRGAGWLLFPLEANQQDFAWLFDYLKSRCNIQTTLNHGNWRALYLVPKEGTGSPDRS